MPDTWLTANGAKVDKLQHALFPPLPEFSYLNTLVLTGEVKREGGGLYREAPTNAFPPKLLGGGAVPVDATALQTKC
jgi:hypothetical protein